MMFYSTSSEMEMITIGLVSRPKSAGHSWFRFKLAINWGFDPPFPDTVKSQGWFTNTELYHQIVVVSWFTPVYPPFFVGWIPISTVDGCEILHHQKDGWNPINSGTNHLSTGAGFRNHPPYLKNSIMKNFTGFPEGAGPLPKLSEAVWYSLPGKCLDLKSSQEYLCLYVRIYIYIHTYKYIYIYIFRWYSIIYCYDVICYIIYIILYMMLYDYYSIVISIILVFLLQSWIITMILSLSLSLHIYIYVYTYVIYIYIYMHII